MVLIYCRTATWVFVWNIIVFQIVVLSSSADTLKKAPSRKPDLFITMSGENLPEYAIVVEKETQLIQAGKMTTLGVMADMITANRKLIEEILRIQRNRDASDR